MSIGENIRNARKDKNFTQTQLAEVLGVQTAAVSKYEKGVVSPTVEQLQKISYALNVSLSELVLLSCPFCGERATIYEGKREFSHTGKYIAQCNGCLCKMGGFQTAEYAAQGWNNRQTAEKDLI